MKIKEYNGVLKIDTTVHQAKNGGIFMDWGNTVIKLEKFYADNIARDIPDFDQEQYIKFYEKVRDCKYCGYPEKGGMCDNSPVPHSSSELKGIVEKEVEQEKERYRNSKDETQETYLWHQGILSGLSIILNKLK